MLGVNVCDDCLSDICSGEDVYCANCFIKVCERLDEVKAEGRSLADTVAALLIKISELEAV